MPTNDQDARALTYLARRLRSETRGAREWDETGTYAVIKAELVGLNLAHAMEQVMCHATDTEARTPGSIRRNFTPPKPSEKTGEAARPLRRSEQCRRCGGLAGGCACTREHMAADEDPPSPDLPPAPPSLTARLARIGSKESDA